MKTLGPVVAGVLLAWSAAAGAQEESRVPPATKEEVLRRLIAVSRTFRVRTLLPRPCSRCSRKQPIVVASRSSMSSSHGALPLCW